MEIRDLGQQPRVIAAVFIAQARVPHYDFQRLTGSLDYHLRQRLQIQRPPVHTL